MKNKSLKIILIVLLIIVTFVVGFLIGKQVNYNKKTEMDLATNKTNTTDKDATDINAMLMPTYVKDFYDRSIDNIVYYSDIGTDYIFEDWSTGGCSKFCCVNAHTETAKATSELANQKNITYKALNIIDLNKETAWSEGVEGSGIGESITVDTKIESLSDEINFTSIVIVNGYSKNEKLWNENNRVRTLKMYYNEKYITEIFLLDNKNPQYFDISKYNLNTQNNKVGSFKFEIGSVYKGTTYDDTVLTGINIDFDIPCH